MNEKIDFIVLNKTDIKDYDEIVGGITPKGRMSFYGRSLKKNTSKNAYALDMFNKAEILYDCKENKTLQLLKSASLKDSFRHIKENLDYQSVCFIFAELINRVIDGSDLYELTLNFFNDLKEYPESLTLFNLNLALILKREGIYPEVNACVISGNKTDIKAVSVPDGGFISKEYLNSDSIILNKDDLRAFRLINLAGYKDRDKLLNLGINNVIITDLLLDFIEYHLSLKLKSRLFFDEYYQGKTNLTN